MVFFHIRISKGANISRKHCGSDHTAEGVTVSRDVTKYKHARLVERVGGIEQGKRSVIKM